MLTAVDLWEFSDRTQHLTHKTICSAQRRINLDPNTDQPSWNYKLQVILLSVHRNDPARNWLVAIGTCYE